MPLHPVARPVKVYNASTSFTAGVPTVADWNGDPDALVVAHNLLDTAFTAHASRHAAGGADPITLSAVGATSKKLAFFFAMGS